MPKSHALDPLTYKIIGCAMNVHQVLGNGFQEVIYQRAMAVEMEDAGITRCPTACGGIAGFSPWINPWATLLQPLTG
ncbi:MAG: GxxExxY protein [Candidatus Zixiibacteriota bacterium]|nr:MAG: GxxExxY protein [candidate division Zixibacteria bacterium]